MGAGLDRDQGLTLAFSVRRSPGLRTGLLLLPPMLWLGVAYLLALGALFITSLWSQNDFTGTIERIWTLDNYRQIWEIPVYRTIAFRTIALAAVITVVDAVVAFPIALYMAKFASPRGRRLLVIAVLMPLWASYLVKAYAWRGIFADGGLIDWLGKPFGISSPGYGLLATGVTLAYLWLPYMVLPVFAGLERVPDSLVDASSDLGAGSLTTLRRVVLPMAFPALVAGSIFTFSLSLGDYIAVTIVGGPTQLLGNVIYQNVGAANNLPFAAALSTIPVVVMFLYLAAARRTGALDSAVIASRGLRTVLRVSTAIVLVLVYTPLAMVVINSFNVDRTFSWPPSGFTLHWWKLAAQSHGARHALLVSVEVALLATAISLVLGTLAGLALRRTRFFGRHTVSLLIILPIALPGIVTGIALNNAFRTMLGIDLGFLTVVIAHATFCIVTVFNNVQARLQRLGPSLEQASADLGAGPFLTFVRITFPMMRSALLAGALLAFGLSFDEIVVTTFTAGPQVQTLPLWIFQNLFRPNQAPIVNVVAAVLVLVSAVPIYLAQRLSGDTVSTATATP